MSHQRAGETFVTSKRPIEAVLVCTREAAFRHVLPCRLVAEQGHHRVGKPVVFDEPAVLAIAEHLASREIYAWSGHFYAVEVIARLGLEEAGGLVRVGLCHYSTAEEVDRLIKALKQL